MAASKELQKTKLRVNWRWLSAVLGIGAIVCGVMAWRVHEPE